MKIMVCYDGSKEAKAALKMAQKNAKLYDAKMEVVKTITREIPLKHSFVEKEDKKLQGEIKDLLGEGDVSYEVELLVTSLAAGEELVKFAEDWKMDQMYIGIVKKSKVGKFIFGSTAQHVILNAPCPVVTVQE